MNQIEIYRNSWIQTYTGKKFYALTPYSADIDIEDIAHALSMQCRFSGHVRRFYSVAQHSRLVASVCEDLNYSREVVLWGLLHDASEAYLTDIPTPHKRTPEFKFYRGVERNLMNAVCDRFELPYEEPRIIKEIDAAMTKTEARDLMGPPVEPWTGYDIDPFPFKIRPEIPQKAKRRFLEMFRYLTN